MAGERYRHWAVAYSFKTEDGSHGQGCIEIAFAEAIQFPVPSARWDAAAKTARENFEEKNPEIKLIHLFVLAMTPKEWTP